MKNYVIFGGILAFIISSFVVLAATSITLNVPGTNDIIFGEITLSATTDTNAAYVKFYYSNNSSNYTQYFIGEDTTEGTEFTLVWDTNNAGDGIYNFTAVTDDQNVNSTNFNITIDNVPTAPANFTLIGKGKQWVSMDWDVALGNYPIVKYLVYRNNSNIDNTTDTDYNDVGLSPSSTYEYIIGAIDSQGHMNNTSGLATVTDAEPSSDGSGTTSPSSTVIINRVMLITYPTPVAINVGEATTIKVSVYNRGDSSFPNTKLDLTGVPSSWSYTVTPTTAFIATNSSQDYELTLNVPSEEAGDRSVTLTVTTGTLRGEAILLLTLGEVVSVAIQSETTSSPAGQAILNALSVIPPQGWLIMLLGVLAGLALKFRDKIEKTLKNFRKPSYRPRGGFLGS